MTSTGNATAKTFAGRGSSLPSTCRADSTVEKVTFHPSNAYEDSIECFRPVKGGFFEQRDGLFVCRRTLWRDAFTRKVGASPYLQEVAAAVGCKPDAIPEQSDLPMPASPVSTAGAEAPPLELGYSDLADYEDCGYIYRLSRVFGFERELVQELGYRGAYIPAYTGEHRISVRFYRRWGNWGTTPYPVARVNHYIDDVYVVPEPTMVSLLAIGALPELCCRRWSIARGSSKAQSIETRT